MARARSLDLKILFAALARAVTANGTGVDLKGYINPGGREMKAFLDVGAVSGTPTLDVKMQDSPDNSVFTDITGATFAQKTAVGSEAIHFRTNQRYVRAVATIAGGTPSFTFGCYLLAEKRLA